MHFNSSTELIDQVEPRVQERWPGVVEDAHRHDHRPRVLFIVNSLPTGGAERHLVDLVRLGVARGRFSAVVVCLKSGGDLAGQLMTAVPVYTNWLKGRYDLSVLSRLIPLVRQVQPDCIYTHSGPNEMLLAQLAGLVGGASTVCAIHTTKNGAMGERFSSVQRMLMRRSTVAVAVAPSHRSYLVKTEGLDVRRTVAICNGVDHRRFRPGVTATRVRTVVPELGERRVIGVVGSLTPEKGHGVLLDALQAVRQVHPDVALAVVGGGPQEGALRQKAARLQLEGDVFFLGVRHDIEQVLPAFEAVALPSLPYRETFSIAALEAMACGVPVVASRVGSMADMVTDGINGWLVPAGDPAALSAALLRVLGDPTQARSMGRSGRQRVEHDFTLEAMVDRYGAMFSRLAARHV